MIVSDQRNLKSKLKMENDNRAQIIERLKQSNNVLITVNNNPSVDQLAACIGFTILLNKLGKHGTAVFSGKVPSTLEFLKPDETLEKNTDSLRDFIIALDKSKADKLRYKVEDTMVKIFITPYKTSISDKDLEFSQGDFNVDVVLALGIHEKEQVDQAIMAHGRILHDAVVMSVNTDQGNVIGTINWVEEQASSLCEMLTSIIDELQPQSLDEQISTALLTGIVAETERFSNDKTTSVTMSMSSKLMAAGANQQLVATELEPKPEPVPEAKPEPTAEEPDKNEDEEDGTVVIDHPEDRPPEAPPESELPPIDPNEIDIDKEGTMRQAAELAAKEAEAENADAANADEPEPGKNRLVVEPPTMGGTLTASGDPQSTSPDTTTDPMSKTEDDSPLLNHTESTTEAPSLGDILSQPSEIAKDNQTLSQLEQEVHREQPEPTPQETVGEARDAVEEAITSNSFDAPPEPIEALGANKVDLDMGHTDSAVPNPGDNAFAVDPSTGQPQFPPNLVPPSTELPSETTASDVDSPVSPPPVPPPMMPPAMPPVDNGAPGPGSQF